ncbi:MAG: hypothetical protein ACKO8I_10090 [Cyanobacteriota bacterium]
MSPSLAAAGHQFQAGVVLSMFRPPFHACEADQQFNNADSFAAAFDEAWKALAGEGEGKGLNRSEKLERILLQLRQHPFARTDATRAREVGEFRLRLHGF